MGCWGMGITQCDEYCEVYDRFLEEYDRGKPLSDIKKDILDEYFDEFDANDGILHNVYFAIGKAEWMCGGISDEIYRKISHIVQTGENIAFYRELGASESDLKLRQKNLDKFLLALSTARGKTKKRKIQPDQYTEVKTPALPPFRPGDVFAYNVNGKYRLLCFVSRGRFCATHAAYCYVWASLYEQIPSTEALAQEPIVPLGYFTAETFPDPEKLIPVGNMPDAKKLDITYPGILPESWKIATWAIIEEAHLSDYPTTAVPIAFSDCLKKLQA